MLPVHWSVEALDNLDEIVRYIAKDNPAAARRMHALCRVPSIWRPNIRRCTVSAEKCRGHGKSSPIRVIAYFIG